MASLTGKTTAVAPSTLNVFHRNPRHGDTAAIAASLKAHGQYKPITVNIGTSTGRPHEVLAGNHTLMAFRDLAERDAFDDRWAKILVHWVDVDDDMCNRIVIADNRTSELGYTDNDTLHELLASFEGTDLSGLGFTTEDITALIGPSRDLLTQFKGIDTGSDDDTGPSGHPLGQPSSGSGPADNQFDGEDHPDNEDADSAQYRGVPGVSVSGNATPEIAISGTFRCPNCNHQFAPGRDADK